MDCFPLIPFTWAVAKMHQSLFRRQLPHRTWLLNFCGICHYNSAYNQGVLEREAQGQEMSWGRLEPSHLGSFLSPESQRKTH